MLERIFRKIVLLFYKEWNTNSIKSFLLLLLVIAYGTLNTIYGINVLLEIVISLTLYIFLIFIKNIIIIDESDITEDKETETKIESKEETDLTFFAWFILIIIDLIISLGVPIYIFQAEYNWYWGLFFSLPVMIGCIIVNTYFLMEVNDEY